MRICPALVTSLALVACTGDIDSHDPGGDELAAAELALDTVPDGVHCVSVKTGATTTSKSVTPGNAPVKIALGTLPLGTLSVSGLAYDAECAAIAGATPTWAASAVNVTIRPGALNSIALKFRVYTPSDGTVTFESSVRDVALSSTMTSVVLADGTVREWGYVLTPGTVGPTLTWSDQVKPRKMPNVTGAVEIVNNDTATCVLLATGKVQCWGEGANGQLGDGQKKSSSLPVSVSGLDDATSLTANSLGFCAVKKNHKLVCWGKARGALADVPVGVWLEEDVFAASLGESKTCALWVDGAIYCWASAAGDGFDAAAVANTAAAIDLSGAANNWCMIRADRTPLCWGSNDSGQLGTGDTSAKASAVAPIGLTDVIGVSVGTGVSCWLRGDGTVKCAGSNAQGGLGDGTGVNSSTPVSPRGLSNVVQVNAAPQRACAVRDDGSLWCWGRNDHGQLGTGDSQPRFVPTAVVSL